jgi:hypothetical protein
MGIESMIQRLCKQNAVYWGNPVPDGKGGYTFDHPVDRDCRWEDKNVLLQDGVGREINARAQVFLLEDVDEQGYLYLGELSDLSTEEGYPNQPNKINGTHEIKQFHKAPDLDNPEEFIRVAYLSDMIGG